MAQKQGKKTATRPLSEEEKAELEELQASLNRQFSYTYNRVPRDYGEAGLRMAESARAATQDQDFVDFLFEHFMSVTTSKEMSASHDANETYAQSLTLAAFMFKTGLGLPVNVPCHAEDVLVGNRYLRRFMREFTLDVYMPCQEQSTRAKSSKMSSQDRILFKYEHDSAWRAELDRAVKTTTETFKVFGKGESKGVPGALADDLKDKGSDFFRFLEVFYDETLFDAELSLSAENAGNDKLVYKPDARRKKDRKAAHRRFQAVIDDAFLFCRMSRAYGVEFALSVHCNIAASAPRQAFLVEFYDTVMTIARMDAVIKRS